MSAVFISYRRKDTEDTAKLIAERFEWAFGAENVYFDVHNTILATEFLPRIERRLAQANIVLAVIGPSWLEELRSREGSPEPDLVRHEIALALERGMRVMPVLVKGMQQLHAQDLPKDLKKLADLQWQEIHREPHFESDVDLVIRGLGGVPKSRGRTTGEKARYWDEGDGRKIGRYTLAALLAAVLCLWLWREVWPPSPVNPGALGHLLYSNCWVTYDPTEKKLDRKLQPVQSTLESIEHDLDIIKKSGFTGIVTADAKGNMAEVPRLAQERGMRVIMGVFDPQHSDELYRAARQAKYVDAYCCGAAGLPDRYGVGTLRYAVDLLKRRTGKPVAVSEYVQQYTEEVAAIGDWLFPDAHISLADQPNLPYCSSEPVRDSERLFNLVVQMAPHTKNGTRPLVFHKVGYPWDSEVARGSSREKQAEFFRRVLQRVNGVNNLEHGLPKATIVAMGAFDTPWKKWPAFEYWERKSGLIEYHAGPGNEEARRAADLESYRLSPAGMEILKRFPHLVPDTTVSP